MTMKEYKVTEKQLESLKKLCDIFSFRSCECLLDEFLGKGFTEADSAEEFLTTLCNEWVNDSAKELERLAEIRHDLKYLVEDIENQPLAPRKEQKTLIEVVGVMAGAANMGGCPGHSEYSEAFRATGYKQPDANCPCGADGHIMTCTDCWRRPAEPLEDEDHAR